AVHSASAEMKKEVKFFVGFADLEASLYRFYFEFVDSATTQAECDQFTQLVDKYLRQENV
ncbi:MAG: hypothetical protein J6W69_00770, partial [Bacteroidales bacterium]|nr:hypothetical protein [Bacteroidales bacterium]